MPYRYALLISYQGSSYCGWQRQKILKDEVDTELSSIQRTLEQSVYQMTGELISVVGSGRTDSGVHAIGQVAHITLLNRDWDPSILRKGLNSILPHSIRILSAKKVSLQFHAQRQALKKQYSYYIQEGPSPIPFMEPNTLWIPKKLDLSLMSVALQSLVGEHDFKAFQGRGSKVGSSVRNLVEAEVSTKQILFPCTDDNPFFLEINQYQLIRIRLVGTGFLKQMVRGITGTLLQIGKKMRPPTCMAEILSSQDRSQVGPTAPGRGLWLEKVWYDPDGFDLNG